MIGFFDKLGVPSGWYSELTQPAGWYDDLLLSIPEESGGGNTIAPAPLTVRSLTVRALVPRTL